jgi:hypothetical protein
MRRFVTGSKRVLTPRVFWRQFSVATKLKYDGADRTMFPNWGRLLGAGFVSCLLAGNHALGDAETPAPPGHPAANLKVVSYDEFKLGKKDRVWVTLDGGVYDVTTFLDAHPGGVDRIQMVNGQDLAKFWGVYDLHDRPHIRALLEEYRIGNMTPCDYKRVKSETAFASYSQNDPHRPAADLGKLRIPR